MKKEPIWVLEKTVLKIHDAQLSEHGGSPGLRDIGLLQSALNHPINLFSYSNSDIHDFATAYAERIIKNHPFVDGNKRTAYVVMSLFLELNHVKLTAHKNEKIVNFVQLAASKMTTQDFSSWLGKNTKSL